MVALVLSPPVCGVWLALAAPLVAAAFWSRDLRSLTAERAIAYERRKHLPATPPAAPEDEASPTLARLAGDHPLTFGVLTSGQQVQVGLRQALFSGLILGAPGMGKTRWLLSAIRTLVLLMATGHPLDVVLVDPKPETFDVAAEWLGGLYLTRPGLRSWLKRSVRVFLFDRDRISPLTPYVNADGLFTNAYLASFRSAVFIDAGDAEFTDATAYARKMYDLVLLDLGWPPLVSVAARFFQDEAFRRRVVLPRLRNPQAKAWAEIVGSLSKGVTNAFLWRLGEVQAYPQLWAALNTPAAGLAGLLPTLTPGLTLARVGPDTTLTDAAARLLARYLIFDVLARIPTRTQARPQLLALEELAALVADSPKLATPIAQALRKSRSFGTAIWAPAQDFASAAPTELTKAFALAARFILAFRSREEAAWLAAQAPESFLPDASDAERRRAFQATVENLPEREAVLWFKGGALLRCTSPEVPDPAAEFGVSAGELRGVFDRELAVNSTITMQQAEALIGAFESEVLGRGEVAPAPEAARTPVFSDMDALFDRLDSEEDADA